MLRCIGLNSFVIALPQTNPQTSLILMANLFVKLVLLLRKSIRFDFPSLTRVCLH